MRIMEKLSSSGFRRTFWQSLGTHRDNFSHVDKPNMAPDTWAGFNALCNICKIGSAYPFLMFHKFIGQNTLMCVHKVSAT